jgi:hypothetical protein
VRGSTIRVHLYVSSWSNSRSSRSRYYYHERQSPIRTTRHFQLPLLLLFPFVELFYFISSYQRRVKLFRILYLRPRRQVVRVRFDSLYSFSDWFERIRLPRFPSLNRLVKDVQLAGNRTPHSQSAVGITLVRQFHLDGPLPFGYCLNGLRPLRWMCVAIHTYSWSRYTSFLQSV